MHENPTTNNELAIKESSNHNQKILELIVSVKIKKVPPEVTKPIGAP
jgi:hypothetical protein